MVTEAEIREDERRKMRERDGAEERERKRNDSWLDRIFGMFSGMGFFEMLLMALIVGGIYMAAKANPEWAEKLVQALPEDWQLNVGGMLNKIGIDVDLQPSLSALANNPAALKKKLTDNDVPLEVVDVIAKDKETFDKFLDIVATANNDPAAKDAKGQPVKGRVTLDGFTNSKTIYALITQQSEMALALATTIKPDNAAAKSDMGKRIMGSFAEIVKSDKLEELLTTHRATTVKLLNKFAPQVTEAQLTKIIEANVAEGKVKADFRTMLITLMTPDAKGNYPDAETELLKLADKDPELAKVLVGMQLNQPAPAAAPAPAPAQGAPQGQAQVSGTPAPDAATAEAAKKSAVKQAVLKALEETTEGKALQTKLGAPRLLKLMAAADKSANPLRDVLRVALKPENQDALPQFLSFVGKVPVLSKELPVNAEKLKQLLLKTGYKDGNPNATLTKLCSDLSALETLNAKTVRDAMTNYILTPEVAKNPEAAVLAKAVMDTFDLSTLNDQEKQEVAQVKAKMTQPKLEATSAVMHADVNREQLLARMSVMNPETKKLELSVSATMVALLDPAVRTDVRKVGTGHVATLMADEMPQLSKANLDALVQFGEDIGKTQGNQGDNADRTRKVVGAFAALLEGKTLREAFKDSRGQLSGFFSVPENHDALLKLSKAIDDKNLTAEQKKAVRMLKKWVGDNKTFGITNYLRDAKNEEDFLKFVGATQEVRSNGVVSRAFDGAKDMALSFEWVQDVAIAANTKTELDAAMFRELRDAFKGVVTQQETTGNPAPTPPAGGRSSGATVAQTAR